MITHETKEVVHTKTLSNGNRVVTTYTVDYTYWPSGELKDYETTGINTEIYTPKEKK